MRIYPEWRKTLLTIIYYYCILLSNTIINVKLVNAKINALFESGTSSSSNRLTEIAVQNTFIT